MNNGGPIFVGGPNRSGSSLMFALLATHPNISMVQRTDMWPLFYRRYGDLSQPDNFERCLTAMLHYRRLTRLGSDPDHIRREFWQGQPTYGRLFALFHEHRAKRLGKRRWGDKSLHTEHYADQVFAEFPQAKMIQIIRDPRDRYASAHKRYNEGVATATGKWLASIKVAKRNLQRYPDRYRVVRYETLAYQPEETLGQVCHFLNEEYTPAMFSMEGAPEHLEQAGDSSFERFKPGEISTRSIGRFRKVISSHEIAFIQMCAGRQMADFDYQVEPVQFSGSDRLLFYLVTLPTKLARLAGWFMRQKIREKRGRTIPVHRVIENAVNEELP